MNNNAQHWQTRMPLRVYVLGLLFLLIVFLLLGVLWSRWELTLWVYVPVVLALLLLIIKAWWHIPNEVLYFDPADEFFLLASNDVKTPIRITHVWYSPLALSIHVISRNDQQRKQLVFWRMVLAPTAWRQLHIYLLRYQLQYQFADPKVLDEPC